MAVPAKRNAVSKKYDELAAELENLVRDGLDENCSEESRKRLHEAVRLAQPELEKFDDALHRIIHAPMDLIGSRIGVDMGLFTKLDESAEPLSTNDIAASLGGDPVMVERLLKFMASLQLIKEVDVNVWGPSRTTPFLANRGLAAGVWICTETCGAPIQALPNYLKRTNYQTPTDVMDSPFVDGHGVKQDFFQYLAERPKDAEEFNHFMTMQRHEDETWLSNVPFQSLVLDGAAEDAPLFVDVGGGYGHQCEALIKAFPSLSGRVVLQDQASVLEKAFPIEGMLKQEVDFFKEQPVKNARVYYFRNVFHDWSDDLSRQILQIIKEVMGPNSLLMIDEIAVPPKGAHRLVMQRDMDMLANMISGERSEDRWQELLSSAGFKIDHIFHYQAKLGDSVIVATPV